MNELAHSEVSDFAEGYPVWDLYPSPHSYDHSVRGGLDGFLSPSSGIGSTHGSNGYEGEQQLPSVSNCPWLSATPQYYPTPCSSAYDLNACTNGAVDPTILFKATAEHGYDMRWNSYNYSEEQAPTPSDTTSQYSALSVSHPGSPMSRASSASSALSEDASRFACAECKASFVTWYKLEEHAKSTGHRSYQCPEPGCRKRYKRRDVYVRHKLNHKQNLVCRYCKVEGLPKSFARKDHLRQHMRTCHASRIPPDDDWGVSQLSLPAPCSSTCCRLEGSRSPATLLSKSKSATKDGHQRSSAIRGDPGKSSFRHPLPLPDERCESDRSDGVSQIIHGLRSMLSGRHTQCLSDIEERLSSMHSDSQEELAKEILSTMSARTSVAPKSLSER